MSNQPNETPTTEARSNPLTFSERDPLGLELDLLHLVEKFGMLNAERDEMTRHMDEDIIAHEVAVKKLNEQKKDLTRPLDVDLEYLERDIKEGVLEFKEKVEVGRWSFGYSTRVKVDAKAMEQDSEKYPGLKKYMGTTEIVTKRFR
jgi:hypothetical protein